MERFPVVILGGGINGRFAKLQIPEAEIFEKNIQGEKFTVEFMSADFSRIEVPELECKPCVMRSLINGKVADHKAIQMYKTSKGNNTPLSYGDIKQFLPEQRVFKVKLPEVPINYGMEAIHIDVFDKTIQFAGETVVGYGCIISTIPLPVLLRTLGFLGDGGMRDLLSFPRKTIYYHEMQLPVPHSPDYSIHTVDYIVDESSPIYRRQYCGDRQSEESYYNFTGAVKIVPGKIFPSSVTEELCDDLTQYSIYCYGRYGRWRPSEHMHETFKHLRRFAERKGQVGYR
jgi:hypothetical protein